MVAIATNHNPLTRKEKMNERILCAAIHFNDGKVYEHQPVNVELGFVVTGRRHHNCYATLTAIGKAIDLEERVLRAFERLDGKRDCQGFITNLNRYVDRKEGWRIAIAANQVVHGAGLSNDENPILISENLY